MPEPSASPGEHRYDADGLVIPWPFHLGDKGIQNWSAQPLSWRRRRSEEYLQKLAEPPKPPKQRRPGVKRFTTQYAVEYGKRMGWKLIQREGYDHRTKRSHDLMIGSDAMFEGPEGIVLIQGAGRGERAEHRRRFEERGGAAACERRRIALFLYLEFERGRESPALREEWTTT